MLSFCRRALTVAVAVPLALTSCGGTSAPKPGASAATTGSPAASTPSIVRNGGVGPGDPARASYAPWPAAGHDARHTGSAPVVGPQTGDIRWKRHLEGGVVPGVVVGNGGIAYAASNGGVLHAVKVSTGDDVWTFDGHATYGSDLSTSPLLTPDGELLWPGPSDKLYGLDAATGKLDWTIPLGAQGTSPQLSPNGNVAEGDTSGVVRALQLHGRAAPTTIWKVDTGSSSYANVVVAADGTTYSTVDRSLVAIRHGRIVWTVAARGQIEVSAAVASGGTIVFGSNDRTLYGVSPAGKVRWTYPLGDLTYSSPSATRDGLVYIGDHFGRVTAVAAADGKPRLTVLGAGRTPGRNNVGVWSEPAIDAHHDVYFGSHPGHVYGFDASGKRLFDVDTGATSASYPALAADGTLLIGNDAGELLAVGSPPH